ncbi:hypothetical protein TOPH_08182 [Tolypocladium ophioglossoides CBS 100239]|uniref:Uncharacterized protein n=1 Tax=Tolypocladium ophioglossoides (strain CBS 100239) TaxID=1163406 RepID=A0A0L0MZ79_TOLOC|nr:hypothetical protein TOPH_08182 [Tolypocladium ophioglossoides CBS 100239]
MSVADDTYIDDDWPTMPDGSEFDGKELLALVRSGKSPFHGAWDVNLLIREIEENLGAQVIEIPAVTNGSNNYGLHMKLSNRPDIVARLARGDVNMPNFDGFPIDSQVDNVKFEAAAYELLHPEPSILVSRSLYYRVPVQLDGPKLPPPRKYHRPSACLAQSGRIRAALFNFNLPLDFATSWFLKRLFKHKPESLPIPVAPTREFFIALFTSKIKATIRNKGDMIGWESDENTVGPIAAAAKQSLLRLISHIMPTDDD